MEKDVINTNLKCLITLPSSAILFFGGDALFFQSTLSLSILGKFNSFIFFFFIIIISLFFNLHFRNYFLSPWADRKKTA